MCLHHILVGFTCSIILSLLSSSPSQNNFDRFHVYFHMWIQNTSTIFTLIPLFLCPLLSRWYPPLEKTYFSLLPFIFLNWVYIDSPRGVHLGTSDLYISFFNQINSLPLLRTHSLSPCSPNIQQLTVQYIILYSYIMGCFNIFHSLTFSFSLPPLIAPSDRLTNTISFCLWLYIYVHTYIYTYTHAHIYIYIWSALAFYLLSSTDNDSFAHCSRHFLCPTSHSLCPPFTTFPAMTSSPRQV
jgi:hypothetical protein